MPKESVEMSKMKKNKLIAVLLLLTMICTPIIQGITETQIFYGYVEGLAPLNTPAAYEGSGFKDASELDVYDQYTVTFLVNGEEYFVFMVDPGALVERPNNPTGNAEDGNFLGWYREEASDDEPFDFLTPISETCTLTARFDGAYMVEYLGVNGNVIKALKVSASDLPVAYVPSAQELGIGNDKSFVYWYLNNATDGSAPERFSFNESLTSNVRLKPYITDVRLVIFVSEGTQVMPLPIDNPNDPDHPVVPRPDASIEMKLPGYTFQWWSTQENGPAYEGFGEPYSETVSLTLYAVWQAVEVRYTIEYWIEKPDVSARGAEVALSEYMFLTTNDIPATALAGSTILAADLTEEAITACLGSSFNKDYTMVKYLQTFFDYRPERLEDIVVAADDSTIIKAYFSRKVFNIYFNYASLGTASTNVRANSGYSYTVGNDTTVHYVSEEPIYKMQVKLDQQMYPLWPRTITIKTEEGTAWLPFKLWGKAATAGGMYNYNRPADAIFDFVTYGAFNNNTYSIAYAGEAESGRMMVAQYNTSPEYVYRIYYLEILDSEITDSAAFVQAEKEKFDDTEGWQVLPKYAEYNGKTYILGELYTTESGQDKTPASYKGWPGRQIEGYVRPNATATGAHNNGDHQGAPRKMLDADGEWYIVDEMPYYYLPYFCDRVQYTLSYNSLGGNIVVDGVDQGATYQASETMYSKSTLPAQVDELTPTKAYAEFLGWYYDETLEGEPAKAGDPVPDRNVTLYAKYKDVGVTVRFFDGSAAPLYTQETRPGGYITPPYDAADYVIGKNYGGKVFDGWVFKLAGYSIKFKFSYEMPIANDLDLEASWIIQSAYTVNYHRNDDPGSIIASYTITPDSTLTKSGKIAPRNPSMTNADGEDMLFLGWYCNTAGTGSRFLATTTVTSKLIDSDGRWDRDGNGILDIYPVFADMLHVTAKDVYASTSLVQSTPDMLAWLTLTAETLWDMADVNIETGHANVRVRSAEVNFSVDTDYAPTANTKAGATAYPLLISVIDSLGRSKEVPINLYVIDTENPVITGLDELKYRVNTLNENSAAAIRADANIVLSDDYASVYTQTDVLESNLTHNYTVALLPYASQFGLYNVIFNTADTVQNQGAKTVKVNLWDEQVTANNITLTITEVLAMQAAEDYMEQLTAKMQAAATYYDSYYPQGDKRAILSVTESVQPVVNLTTGYPVLFKSENAEYTAVVYVVADEYVITPQVVNGSISPAAPTIVKYGQSQTFTYEPDMGCELVSVAIGNTALDTTQNNRASYTFNNVIKNDQISVVYRKIDYRFTVKHLLYGAASEVEVYPTETSIKNYGDSYTAAALHTDDKYALASVSKSEETGTMPNGDHTVIFYYVPNTYNVNTSVQNGTITPTRSYAHGENAVITYAPANGYQLTSITIDGEVQKNLTAMENSYTFRALTQRHSIRVVYSAIPYTLTVYHYLEGTTTPVHEPTVKFLTVNAPYVVYAIRSIEGYKPLKASVSGIMPTSDKTEILYYRATETDITPIEIPPDAIDDARDRTTPPMFVVFDIDIPLAGGASRSMGDKEE